MRKLQFINGKKTMDASRRLAARLVTRPELRELTETWKLPSTSRTSASRVSTRSFRSSPASVLQGETSSGRAPNSIGATVLDRLKQTLSPIRRALPLDAALSRLPTLPSPNTVRRAMAYHVASLYERYHKPLLGTLTLALAGATYTTTHALMATVADSTSVSLATVSAVSTTLALAVVLSSLTVYLRYCTIRPDAVYRKAMMRLNAHPGVLEVLGAPVVGSSTRASVVQGGGLVVEGGRLRMAPKRVDMVWQLTGGYRGRGRGGKVGLVSVEGAKEGGTLRLKVLALDVEHGRGGVGGVGGGGGVGGVGGVEERGYVIGGLREYEAGGVLEGLKATIGGTGR